MIFQNLELEGAALVTPRMFEDDRGFFTERFRTDQWQAFHPKHSGFIQDNYSWSRPNVLRGLHFQMNPAQGKLVTCIEGATLNVILDIREKSLTFGKHLKISLNSRKPQWIWIPPGFAHGFYVTTPEGAGLFYKVDQPYCSSTENTVLWNDPELGIEWPASKPILSLKDSQAQTLSALCVNNHYSASRNTIFNASL